MLGRFQRHPPGFSMRAPQPKPGRCALANCSRGTALAFGSPRDWQIWVCTRLLSETKQVRFLHPALKKVVLRALHSTGSGQSLLSSECRFESGSAFQTFWGCGPTDPGHTASNREIRVRFSASPPALCSRGLTHDDASVLTRKSGLDSRREFQSSGRHNRTAGGENTMPTLFLLCGLPGSGK